MTYRTYAKSYIVSTRVCSMATELINMNLKLWYFCEDDVVRKLNQVRNFNSSCLADINLCTPFLGFFVLPFLTYKLICGNGMCGVCVGVERGVNEIWNCRLGKCFKFHSN